MRSILNVIKNNYVITSKSIEIKNLHMSINEFKFNISANIKLDDHQIIANWINKVNKNLLTLLPPSSFKIYLVYITNLETLTVSFEYKSDGEYIDYPNKLYSNILNIIFKNIRPSLDSFNISIPKISRKIEKISFDMLSDKNSILIFEVENKKYYFTISNRNNNNNTLTFQKLKKALKSINDACIKLYFEMSIKSPVVISYDASRLFYLPILENEINLVKQDLELLFKNSNKIVQPLINEGKLYSILENLPDDLK